MDYLERLVSEMIHYASVKWDINSAYVLIHDEDLFLEPSAIINAVFHNSGRCTKKHQTDK